MVGADCSGGVTSQGRPVQKGFSPSLTKKGRAKYGRLPSGLWKAYKSGTGLAKMESHRVTSSVEAGAGADNADLRFSTAHG